MEIAVRPAALDDVLVLHRLRVEAEDWLAARGIEQWGKGWLSSSDLRAQVVEGQWHVGVTRSGDIAGGLRLLWSDRDVWLADDGFAAYVHGLVIDRRLAGLGIGSRLLAWVEDRARMAQASMLRLDCVESNAALRPTTVVWGFVRSVGETSTDRGSPRPCWRSL